MPASGDLPRLPPSGKPLITKRLAAWWALAAGVVVALVFVATDHMWRATGTLALTLLGAASVARLASERDQVRELGLIG